jgi:hypothetical protein
MPCSTLTFTAPGGSVMFHSISLTARCAISSSAVFLSVGTRTSSSCANTLYTFDSASGAFRRKFLGIAFHVAVQSHHGAADTDADVGGVDRWIECELVGYALLQFQFLGHGHLPLIY